VHLLRKDRGQTLIFCRTKHGSDRLCRHLSKGGFQAEAIHGNKSQNARTRSLQDFKSGRTQILVATDIAARGLDIDQLPMVINFDLPMVPQDYIHRIGRTGRAGVEGRAVSLVTHEEQPLLRDIQGLIGRKIEIVRVEGF
jgi:ATP-dependent RNA helicase RhlE